VPKPRSTQTEVVATAENDRRQRRRFSAEDKERILREAEACTERGQLAELLRREGLYSSQLANWRVQRTQNGQAGLVAKKPGPKPTKDAKDRVIEQQARRIAKLQKENRIQKGLLDLQRKAHEILGVALPGIEDETSDSASSSSHSAPRRSR
jgi:transposase